MANKLQPFGFQPIRNKATIGGLNNDYRIDPTLTELIGIGDMVRLSSGYIVKAGPTHTPIGTFQGWNFATRAMGGGSQGGMSDGSIPWRKAWNGAVTVPTNMAVQCLIDDDPFLTFRVQTTQTIELADVGKLVDLVDCPGGPDVRLFGRGKQSVSYPTTYYNITAYSVDSGGSGYTQDGVDLVINGVIQDIPASAITVTAGAVAAISHLNQVQGLPTNTPTSTFQPKPGYSGSGAVLTTTKSAGQTAAQFRIERVLEMPFRQYDTANNTTGYDLSSPGLYSLVEVSYAKHARGSTVAAG